MFYFFLRGLPVIFECVAFSKPLEQASADCKEDDDNEVLDIELLSLFVEHISSRLWRPNSFCILRSVFLVQGLIGLFEAVSL